MERKIVLGLGSLLLVATVLFSAPASAGVALDSKLDPAIVGDGGGHFSRLDMGDGDLNFGGFGGSGGFGGPTFTAITIDWEAFDPMTRGRGMGGFDQNIVLFGGMGGAIIDELRFGGFGWGHSQEKSAEGRFSKLEMGAGGFFAEWNPDLSPNVGLALGSQFGWGALEVQAGGADIGRTVSESTPFFMAYPYLGFWTGPADWVWFKFDVGYMFMAMDIDENAMRTPAGYHLTNGDPDGGVAVNMQVHFGHNPNGR